MFRGPIVFLLAYLESSSATGASFPDDAKVCWYGVFRLILYCQGRWLNLFYYILFYFINFILFHFLNFIFIKFYAIKSFQVWPLNSDIVSSKQMVQVDVWRVGHVVPCPLGWTSWAHRAHFRAIESETFVFRVRSLIPARPKVIDQTLWACSLPWLHRAECQCPCLSSEHQIDVSQQFISLKVVRKMNDI